MKRKKSPRSSATRASTSVYQFKITLDHVRPTVWRRIIVPGTYTLWDLSVIILEAMGWGGGHLHGFKTIERRPADLIHFGIPHADFPDNDLRPMWQEKIMDWFVPGKREKIKHEYDYGDGWEHMVQLEKVFPPEKGMKYPICTAGKNSCPPDDVGGPWGYERFLKIIRNPKHPERTRMLEWADEQGFDAYDFKSGRVIFSTARERTELLKLVQEST